MQIVNKFEYKPLQRTEGAGGRRYIVGQGRLLPSVTTILSKTKDMTHINEWVNRVGENEANRIKSEASNLGSGMHKNIENYILGLPVTGSFMAKTLANVIIKNGLSKVNEVWGIEISLYSGQLYAGTTDLVGVHDGKSSIMDFKNSLRNKKKEWIEDYFLQCCAYSLSHNEMYGTNIRRGVIMIATRDAAYQEFIIEGKEFDYYEMEWCKRLEKYYRLYSDNIDD